MVRHGLAGTAVGAHLTAARPGNSEFVTHLVALLRAQPDGTETLEYDRQ